MQCFLHREVAAIGVCRSCGKGLCPACAREIDRGIVCADACAEFSSVQHQIVDRAKRVYSIGMRPKIPALTLFLGTCGIFVVALAIIEWLATNNEASLILAGFGVLLLGFSLFMWQRYRSVGFSL